VLDPEQARFRLFDSLTTFLKRASAAQPLVLILDDLHCADNASLLLLQFLARELQSSGLLVVGTYRDVEVGPQHPLGVHDRKVRSLSAAGLPLPIFRHNMPKDKDGGGDGGGLNGAQGCGAHSSTTGSATCHAAGLGVGTLDEVHQERLRMRRRR
jgi:hypothetical protein